MAVMNGFSRWWQLKYFFMFTPTIGEGFQFDYTPQKKTRNLRMDPWNRRFLLETMIFRFYVHLPGCNMFSNGLKPNHQLEFCSIINCGLATEEK